MKKLEAVVSSSISMSPKDFSMWFVVVAMLQTTNTITIEKRILATEDSGVDDRVNSFLAFCKS
jgi:hypothetical protein